MSFKSFFLFAGSAQQHSQRKEEKKGEKSLALVRREKRSRRRRTFSVSSTPFPNSPSLVSLLKTEPLSRFPPAVGFLGGLNYVEGREGGKKETSLFLGRVGKIEKERKWKKFFFLLFWPGCIITIHPNALLENTSD